MLAYIKTGLLFVAALILITLLSIGDFVHFLFARRKSLPLHAILFKYEGKQPDKLVPYALLGQAAYVAIKDKFTRPEGDREVGLMKALFQKRLLQLMTVNKETFNGLSTSS